MKTLGVISLTMLSWFSAVPVHGQYTKPDLVERAVKAVTKALLFVRDNRDGGIEMIMRHGQVDKEVATSLYDLMRDAFSPELTPEGVMQRAELEIATLKERPNFDPKAFMDDRFLKMALRSLGR